MKKHNIQGSLRRTVQTYHLIQDGDRIAVGLSGGKDSMALLHVLANMRRFAPFAYELFAVTVNPGFQNFDLDRMTAFCRELSVPYFIEHTEIADIVFNIRKEKNPCSLCANIRRGTLASVMNRHGIDKLALGHHADDRLETFLLSFLYGGNLKTLEYRSYLDRSNITVIRPFIETSEESIELYVKEHDIPVLKSPCPVDKKTKREDMHTLVKHLEKQVPNARKSMLRALTEKGGFNLFKHLDL